MRIAEAAIAAFGDRHAIADLGEICKQGLAVSLVDLGADRHLQDDVLAVRTSAVLSHAVSTALRLEVLLITVVDEGIQAGNRFHHDIAATAAVAAIRAAEFNEFFAPKRHAAVSARAGRDVDLGFIEEFHGVTVYRIGATFAKERRE